MITLTDAIALACTVHNGEKRKNGEDYILHPIRVMMAQNTTLGKILAVLHDVVEDSNLTLEEVRKKGYYLAVIEGLDLLTHRKDETYEEYIRRIADSHNVVALKVKIADLRDNMDMSQLPSITEQDVQRTCKYVTALAILLETQKELT